jgi:glutathione synthase/RimK-type ligase-like ATP-grasp enzyme
MNKKVYLYYSGATDVTGPKLAEALKVDSGKDFPKDKDLVIGWGCKLKKDYKFPSVKKMLNHPNKIRANRDKYNAMVELTKKDVPVADYQKVGANAAFIKKHGFPLIGRRNYHQGGKHFWLIMNQEDLKAAITDGAQYIQRYIDIKDEYRAHVAFGDVLYVAKKVTQTDPSKAWKKQRIEKIEQKFNIKFDELPAEQKKLLGDAVDLLSKEHTTPDRIIRSNKRGWKFKAVAAKNVPASIKSASLAAVTALGLDFGAVDLVLDLEGNPYILEVNSAPGLEGTAFEKWSKALEKKLAEMTKPKAKPKPKKAKPATQAAAMEETAVGAQASEAVEGVDKESLKSEILNDLLAKLGKSTPEAKGPNHQKLLDIVQDLEEDGAEGMLGLLEKLKEAGI